MSELHRVLVETLFLPLLLGMEAGESPEMLTIDSLSKHKQTRQNGGRYGAVVDNSTVASGHGTRPTYFLVQH